MKCKTLNLVFCSLTGADDAVDINQLSALSARFPFVEWAILYSPTRLGTPRYPSLAWINAFHAALPGVQKAIHLCGDAVLQFEQGLLDALIAPFNRVQLNFNANRYKGELAKLAEAVARLKNHEFIVQHNAANENALSFFNASHHAVLFDASGGRGKLPERWIAPLLGRFCGYAGGLSPETLETALPAIQAVSHGLPLWVDMESGIRNDDDSFSLDKAEKVLNTVSSIAMQRQAFRLFEVTA